MDHLVSMYIDNELSLGEKILFLEHVHANKPYKDDAVDLLEQEKLLSGSLNKAAPVAELKLRGAGGRRFSVFSRSLGWAVAACLLLVLSFMGKQGFQPPPQNQLIAEPGTVLHRFVIHHKGSDLVEIAGSFTDWQHVSLVPSGTSGYWEISLELPAGEHRYTFIVDGSKYIPDPTVVTRELDDFGSTNSILKVKA